MDISIKQRLIGAAVLAGLAVIFVPMLVEHPAIPERRIEESNIPPQPEPQSGEFTSKIIPLEPVQPVTPVLPTTPTDNVPAATVENIRGATDGGEAAVKPRPNNGSAVPEVPAAAVDGNEEAAKRETDARVGVNAWAVQLGSFASEQNARDLESRLQKEGYAAFVEKISNADGTKFRVRIGPELMRAKAEQSRQKLEKDLNLKGIVVRYP